MKRIRETAATIHVVDDDQSFRTAMLRLLRAAGYESRAYASAGEFLMTRRGSGGPECLVLDVQMPGPSGLDLQKTLLESGDSLPIIFLSGQGSIPVTVRVMKAGAVNFLTKPVKGQVLLATIAEALDTDAEARAARESLRSLRGLYETLTPREQQVLDGVVAGKLNKEIAAELGTVERTVKAHRANVMEKMQATSLAELVRLAETLHRDGAWKASRPQA